MTDADYLNLVRPYGDALEILMSRLHVLEHGIYKENDRKVIHFIQHRIKSKTSTENKLAKKGAEATVMNAKDFLQDIAGIRVICYFANDIYELADNLKHQADIIFVRESDYIKSPKQNGYRSYHMIVGIPVYYMDTMEYYPVEIQFRTLSMDFWASIEHRILYKKENENREQIAEELKQYSEQLKSMEYRLYELCEKRHNQGQSNTSNPL